MKRIKVQISKEIAKISIEIKKTAQATLQHTEETGQSMSLIEIRNEFFFAQKSIFILNFFRYECLN